MTLPLFCLSELLLGLIRDGGELQLTAKGNLPARVCELLFSKGLIQWKYMEYMGKVREENIPYLWPLKQYLLEQGIVKKRGNALSLTKSGSQFIEQSRATRFKKLLLFFGKRFHWGNFYELPDDGKCGQLGWAFSLLLLSKYGDQARESSFYSLKLMRAFEKEMWDRDRDRLEDRDTNSHRPKEEEENTADYHLAYAVRFFDCFANWFGLVNIERKKYPDSSISDQPLVKKSGLFDHLFELRP